MRLHRLWSLRRKHVPTHRITQVTVTYLATTRGHARGVPSKRREVRDGGFALADARSSCKPAKCRKMVVSYRGLFHRRIAVAKTPVLHQMKPAAWLPAV